jgi:hypothetical protein
VAKKQKKQQGEIIGFVGVGLDNADGHLRVTKSEHFVLVSGSAQAHERMQNTAIRFDEVLQKRGKTLQEASAQEVIEILHEAHNQDS